MQALFESRQPAFCIGYFHGTTKRVITSWAVTSVIFAVVVGVKQLENPYRAIIDAGVIVGLGPRRYSDIYVGYGFQGSTNSRCV